MAQRNKAALLNLRVDQLIKTAGMRAAAADRRSLTSLIEILLAGYCREHGFLPKIPLDQPATLVIGPDVQGETYQKAPTKQFARGDEAIRYAIEKLEGSSRDLSRIYVADQVIHIEEMQEIYDTYLTFAAVPKGLYAGSFVGHAFVRKGPKPKSETESQTPRPSKKTQKATED